MPSPPRAGEAGHPGHDVTGTMSKLDDHPVDPESPKTVGWQGKYGKIWWNSTFTYFSHFYSIFFLCFIFQFKAQTQFSGEFLCVSFVDDLMQIGVLSFCGIDWE